MNRNRKKIMLHVTTKCNLRCPYCWNTLYGSSKMREHMSQETAIKAFDWIHKHGDEDVIVSLFGGEPLFNWPLVKFIIETYATKKYSLTTNATLLTEEIVNVITKYASMGISLSIDGTPEENKEVRGAPYDKELVKRILLMPNTGVRIVCANPERLYDSVMYFREELGAKKVYINFRRHIPNPEEYYKEIDAQFARLWDIPEIRETTQFPYADTECRQCTAETDEKREISIMPNGDLYVCNVGYWIGWGHVGNIATGIDWELWDKFAVEKAEWAKTGVYSLCSVEQKACLETAKCNWRGEKKYFTYREGLRSR